MSANGNVRSELERIRRASEAEWAEPGKGGRPVLMVGTATCGRAAGALETLKTLREETGSLGIDAAIVEVGCNGHCYAEPLVTIAKPGWPPVLYGPVKPGLASVLVKRFLLEDDPCLEYVLGALEPHDLVPALSDFPRSAHELRLLLAKCGRIDPMDIRSAIATGAYGGLAAALEKDPAEIIQDVRSAQLRGLGGAGYETWKKWRACRESSETERFVICNADEGDPGAFMDRSLLESDPHSVLEGVTICARAVGACKGYVYIRAEYPLAVERVRHALAQARELGLSGKNILGSGFDFDMRVFQAAGAFVCGEETALIASIEGKRGMPRIRPPYPAEKGLHGKPTVINNVKTFASVAYILTNGWQKFASIGKRASKGTTVFALAGKILNTGLVEVPMATSLRRLIFDIGGGVPGGKAFKAVQIGGPSGGCLSESRLDVPIGFKALKEAGAMMGSGGMVVLDEDNCMVETARFFLEFVQKESCGKCTFCRIGTRQMLEILEDVVQGRGTFEQLDLLESLAEDIRLGSLCNLGRTAPNPVLTTLRYFRDEYEAHIREGRCPARACRALTAHYILPDRCERTCDACVGSCPTEAIWVNPKRIKVIDQALCIQCGACLQACPRQYDAVVKISPLTQLPDRGKRPEEQEAPEKGEKGAGSS
ncbi:MAG: NADH-ubiquinone oxidoreductase-F iron-sulfur binding region domain-containing protein [bacterium]